MLRLQTIKFPEKKSGESPNIGFGNNFLDMTPKHMQQQQKNRKMGLQT